ncbi:MAG TPA: glycoside hydrolase family 25 protein [Clostridia bacterium]|nr:glycoside hydrolase family 25 protein [Clostridia bacterium]
MSLALKGIDVSHYQGLIDWAKVKATGYKFALIKATYGWDNDKQVDPKFKTNVAGCEAAGIDYGLYHYSYAMTPEDAIKEAKFFLKHIAGLKPAMPVAFDFEEVDQIGGTKYVDGKAVKVAGLPLETQLQIIEAFMSVLEKAGYFGMIYMSTYYLQKLYNYAPARVAKFAAWIAQYASACTYIGKVGIWQHGVIGSYGVKGKDYTIDGAVPGVSANCDVNECYVDYPAIIKQAGLNGWAKTDEPNDADTEFDYQALYEAEKVAHDILKADFVAYKAGIRAELTAMLESY